MIADKPWAYADTTDAFGHTLLVRPVEASTYDGTIPVVSLSVRVNGDASDSEPIVYVRTEDIDQLLEAVRSAAGGTASLKTAPQTPGREQEIRARAEAATPGLWGTRRDLDGTYTIEHGTRITLTEGFGSDGEVAVLVGDETTAYRNSEFITRARADVPWLLDENARLRAELSEYEVLNPQQCPAGKHAAWLVDSEYAHACPWCEIDRLRADRDAAASAAVPALDRANLRQQLAFELYAAGGPFENADQETLADAVLPVVEVHTAAAVRRALEDVARCPSQIGSTRCALPARHGCDHRNSARNHYWSDEYADHAAAEASPAREQGQESCRCGHLKAHHMGDENERGCYFCWDQPGNSGWRHLYVPTGEQGEDAICGNQFDDLFCDCVPGHDGHHGYDTTAWDSTATPAREQGEDDVLADLIARCPKHGTRTETWPECRCAAARKAAAAMRTTPEATR